VNEPKASRYHKLRRRAAYGSAGISAALFAGLLLTGASAWLRDLTGGSVAAYVVLLTLFHEAVSAPVAWYRSWSLERQYGLSAITTSAWLGDYVKAAVIALVTGLAGAPLILAAVRAWPVWWWIPAAAGTTACAALLTFLGPALILPLFHRSRPLVREPLRGRLEKLAARAGVRVPEVHEWDLGDRTRRVSAALVGSGATRRILVSNTLLADCLDDEIEVVAAHEMGHHVHHDVGRGLAAEGVVLLAAFFVAAIALDRSWSRLGLGGPSDVAGLPLILLSIGGVSLLARPFRNALSRRMERAADEFALRVTSNPEAFSGALRRMAAHNLVEERPSRAIRWLFHTHPTIDDRLARAHVVVSAARRLEEGRDGLPVLSATAARERGSSVEAAGA
jgi:Zn-dependent protease with chaperone function